jgi:hypothetical protein
MEYNSTPGSGASDASGGRRGTTRRQLLAAGGALAAVSLSGCLDQVASATTDTGAAPAAFFGGSRAVANRYRPRLPGDGAGEASFPVPSEVSYVPASIRGGSGLLSADIELEGWGTTTTTRAQGYNSSRSNKPSTVWWDGDDADSDDDGIADAVEPLYDYLGGEATVGERFAVSLPDARLPGGRGALADELTPRRLLDYLLGEPDAERCAAAARDANLVVHRDLGCRTLLSVRLDGQKAKKRGVAAYATRGGAVATGVPADIEGAAPMVFVAEDGTVSTDGRLDSWGPERGAGDARVTGTLVCPVLATPADCPCPIPGLLYVRRCRHDGQCLYVGGWVVDDGALYENVLTLLIGEGPTEVAGVTGGDLDGDGYGDLVNRRLSRERSEYGAVLFSGAHDPEAPFIPEALQTAGGKKGYDYYRGGSRSSDDGDAPPRTSTVAALDAPVCHLVEAADSSNDVKFNAGAELSKAVN